MCDTVYVILKKIKSITRIIRLSYIFDGLKSSLSRDIHRVNVYTHKVPRLILSNYVV